VSLSQDRLALRAVAVWVAVAIEAESIYGGALAGRRLQHPGGRNATSSIEVFALALSNRDS
jgi:hypothetical protein